MNKLPKKKKLSTTVIISFLLLFGLWGSSSCNQENTSWRNSQNKKIVDLSQKKKLPAGSSLLKGSLDIHISPIAGSWYPENPEELSTLLNDYLAQVPINKYEPQEHPVAFIVPHAGYIYSGLTAAYAYKILQQNQPERILLIGPSHYSSFHGISLGYFRSYKTPLGEIPVDPLAKRLLDECSLIKFQADAHRQEHSIDIQIPFLQTIFPQSPPKIIPLLVGHLEDKDYSVLAQCLRKFMDNNTTIIISSDFTHYGPRYSYYPFPYNNRTKDNIRDLDRQTFQVLSRLNRKNFISFKNQTGITICGYRPIALLLELLSKDCKLQHLYYNTSGQVTDDFKNSVSYFSLAVFKQALREGNNTNKTVNQEGHRTMGTENTHPQQSNQNSLILSSIEKTTLLQLARDTLKNHLSHQNMPKRLEDYYSITPNLQQHRGAFVTLKKNDNLRGCIGYIQPVTSLHETVQQNVINAATRDSRFPVVKLDELSEIEIEISALSQPELISSYKNIVLGNHGIILKKGNKQAVFLPQVAVEQHWDLAETLRHLSLKAGLSADGWQHPKTQFHVFIAEVFSEHRP